VAVPLVGLRTETNDSRFLFEVGSVSIRDDDDGPGVRMGSRRVVCEDETALEIPGHTDSLVLLGVVGTLDPVFGGRFFGGTTVLSSPGVCVACGVFIRLLDIGRGEVVVVAVGEVLDLNEAAGESPEVVTALEGVVVAVSGLADVAVVEKARERARDTSLRDVIESVVDLGGCEPVVRVRIEEADNSSLVRTRIDMDVVGWVVRSEIDRHGGIAL